MDKAALLVLVAAVSSQLSETADPCKTNNGGCSQLCDPVGVDMRECKCNKGFELDDETNCENIDVCATPGTCSQVCKNLEGSYKCECFEYYILTSQHYCKAIGVEWPELTVSVETELPRYRLDNTDTRKQTDSSVNSPLQGSKSQRPVFIHTGEPVKHRHVLSASSSSASSRGKRAAVSCRMPPGLLRRVKKLNKFLNSSQFVGLVPHQDGPPIAIPDNQPPRCDNDKSDACYQQVKKWWGSRTEPNLTPICPWRETERDLGEDIYPRYVREAECYCNKCQKVKSLDCMKLSYEIRVFQHQGCGSDGLAMMTQKSMDVTVGCYCMNGVPQGTAPDYDDSFLS